MKRRGVTLIELLVALFLLAVALLGVSGLWSFGYSVTGHSQDVGAAYNIARRQVEEARNIGFLLLPEGTQTLNYDGAGDPTDGTPHYVVTRTVHTVPDASGQLNTGCLRELTVTVQDEHETAFQTTTYLTRGGL